MINTSPLSLLEEFLLLTLNEETGQMYPVAPVLLNRAVAGAVLMDLSLRNRIDNDLRDMFTVDPTLTGDDILDSVLQKMAQAPVLTPHPTSFWINEIAQDGEAIQKKIQERLEKRGVIKFQSLGFFWMMGVSSKPSLDEQIIRNLKSDLLGVVYGNEVPSVRSIMLTSLAHSCDLFQFILGEEESAEASKRIAKVSRMDLIGQTIVPESATEPGVTLAAASVAR